MKKISDYPETAQQIIIHTNIQKLKGQPEYYQAKYLACSVKAYEMSKRLIKIERLRSIFHHVDIYKNVYIVPVQQAEKFGYNVIPLGLAYLIKERFGFKMVKNIYRTKGVPNTGKSLIDRACNNIIFEGKIPEKGAQYILVDDTHTTGKTLKCLADHISEQGGNVACLTTLSTSRYGVQFKPTQEQLEILKDIPNFRHKLDTIYGTTEEYLTGGQIQSFLFRNSQRNTHTSFLKSTPKIGTPYFNQ